MRFSKSKWLAYTFLVGLIPVLTRLLAWTVTTTGRVDPLAATDLVAFGLVLHISIINEVEHLPSKEKDWKTIQNGTSLTFITLYSALFAMAIIGEKSAALIDSAVLMQSSVALAAVSSLLSFSVFHRLARLYGK